MKGLGRFLSEAFFPQSFTCDICGIETFGTNLCDKCKGTINFNDGITCPVCGRQTITNGVCIECKDNRPIFRQAVSALVYEDGCVALIVKFKNGNGYLKEYFADLIAEKLKILPKADAIIYVPMTKNAEIKREYNQSELIAKCLTERTGIPTLKDAVIKTKDTKEQKTLSRKEREKNLKTCFKVEKRAEVKDKNILLVDDVMTTGATADAISEKLLDAGAKNVYLATVASVKYAVKRNTKSIDNLPPF